MDTKSLINKLKLKAEENDKYVADTCKNQADFIEDITNFNQSLRGFIERDIFQKNSLKEGNDKMFIMRKRVETCKLSIMNVKDRLDKINRKLANKT